MDGTNTYSYANGKPLVSTDPSGLFSIVVPGVADDPEPTTGGYDDCEGKCSAIGVTNADADVKEGDIDVHGGPQCPDDDEPEKQAEKIEKAANSTKVPIKKCPELSKGGIFGIGEKTCECSYSTTIGIPPLGLPPLEGSYTIPAGTKKSGFGCTFEFLKPVTVTFNPVLCLGECEWQ